MFFASDSNPYPLFYQQSPLFCTNDVLDYNNNTLFHLHHGRYNNSGNYLLQPTYPSSSENPIVKLPLSEPSINQENTINCPSNVINPVPETRRGSTGKKDRHTKICTAQGIRDRRVRLSMNIAREFFNLQDMLGFDKASETLGWLLDKSKAAIYELASTSKDLNEEDDECVDDDKSGPNGRSSSTKRKRRELNRLKEQHLVEELRREKARERARERTRKKKTFVIDDHNNNNHQQQQYQLEGFDHHQQQQQIHQRIQHDLMIRQLSSSSATPNSIPSISKGVSVGETVVVNKDNRSRSSVNYNYEMMSSKDDDQVGGIHYKDCFNKFASENCNYSGIMQQPATLFPALNIINLSTEIHINARPWDLH